MKRLLGISSLFFVSMISSMEQGLSFEEDEMVVGGSLYLIAQQRRKAMAATIIITPVQNSEKEDQSKASD
jgi:hypothetical protein